MALGDVNGDGQLDIIAANMYGDIEILFNGGSNDYTSRSMIYTNSEFGKVAVADLDGLNNKEVLYIDSAGARLVAQTSNGNGGYTPADLITGGSGTSWLPTSTETATKISSRPCRSAGQI